MKVLDVDVLHQGIDDILVKLQSMNEQIQQVHKDVEGIISLKESFKGKGGQAIRSYYEECHMPLLIFFEEFLMLYSETLQRTKQHLQALEPSYTGFIRQSFLESEIEQGLQNADNVTRDLTDEANGIIQSVSDIVLLPRLEDDEFSLHVRQAKQQKQETIEKLNEFDQQQTQALTNVRQELEKMHQYVQKIRSMFKSGEINISNFKIEQLADVKAYQNIQAAIQPKGMSGSIKEVWEVLFGPNANLLSVQYQLRNQLRRLMPLQFLPLGNGIGTQPSSYIPQYTFYPFGYTATPTNAYYTNDGKKVNITNLSHNNGFTDEEIEGLQKYLADLESGKVESNINDIRIESDDTMEYNIFPTPLGGGNPEFDQITKFLFDLLAGDVVTIVDPNSSLMEKIYSAAMLLPPAKAAKAIKLLDHIKDVENVKHVTKGTGNIIDPKVVDEILETEKGSRPNPSTYLSKEYIDSHLAMFDGGVAKIQWGAPTRPLGPPSGTFVMSKSVADDLIEKSGGDVSKLEKLLSLDPGTLGSAPVRVDIPKPTGLRIPDGNEVGANSQWIPGGYTAGGIPEVTIDQVPLDKLKVTKILK